MNKNLLYLVILFFCSSISSQEIFKKIDATNFQENNTEKPKAFEQFQLSTTRLLKTLNNVSQRGYKRSTPTNLSLPNGLALVDFLDPNLDYKLGPYLTSN